MLKFTKSELKNIKVNLNIDNKLYVIASESHITQVMLNLVSNAIRAILKSGNNEEGQIIIRCKNDDNKAIISVIDNGIGIKKEDLEVIFNPFFNSNNTELGIGLNLSYTIISNHNGKLKVTSEFGKGSNFYFELPIW